MHYFTSIGFNTGSPADTDGSLGSTTGVTATVSSNIAVDINITGYIIIFYIIIFYLSSIMFMLFIIIFYNISGARSGGSGNSIPFQESVIGVKGVLYTGLLLLSIVIHKITVYL